MFPALDRNLVTVKEGRPDVQVNREPFRDQEFDLVERISESQRQPRELVQLQRMAVSVIKKGRGSA